MSIYVVLEKHWLEAFPHLPKTKASNHFFLPSVFSKSFFMLYRLCAEGCYIDSINYYYAYDKRRDRIYFRKHRQIRIEFGNKNQKILDRFQDLVFAEYNYKSSRATDRIKICKRNIIYDILSYTQLGHSSWTVPKAILNCSKIVKIAFLKGYFDGDGTLSNRCRFFSTNKGSLQKVSQLLKTIKIGHIFHGPTLKENKKPMYEVYIYEKWRESFLNTLKPVKM